MKTPVIPVLLVAVASSLVTFGAVELLRSSPEAAVASAHEESLAGVEPAAPGTPAVAAPGGHDALADLLDRLRALERRLAELEDGPARRVAEGGEETLATDEDLRDLVLTWVAEDDAARGQAAQLEQEIEARLRREFDARFQAHALALQHDLEPWQEDEFAALFLEIGLKAAEIEAAIDIATADPEEVEKRWEAYDEWVDQLERELTARVDPQLYEEIYGDG